MGVRLPAEYQEVEYLESTGTQFIVTDVYPATNNYGVRAEVEKTVDGQNIPIFGLINMSVQTDSNETSYPMFPHVTPYSNRWYFASNGNEYNRGVYEDSIGTRYRIVYNDANHQFSINGDVIYSNIVVTDNDINKPLAISFRGQYVYPVYSKFGIWKYFVFEVFDNQTNAVIADYVPCYRKSDSEPGMYDLVSKTFYTNQGTGEFLVGPDVVNHISPRLMDRRRALIAKLTSLFRKVITSQTGLASFDTNVAKPMKVTCEFSPKQDLHGYDNPWPAGGGKNKWSGGDVSGTSYHGVDFSLPPGTYTISGNITSAASNTSMVLIYTTGSNSAEVQLAHDGSRASATFTVADSIRRIVFYASNTAAASEGYAFSFTNIQIEEGSTATTYAPYENICPIEGWDGANIPHTGKNLLDLSDLSMITCYIYNSGKYLEQVRRGKRIDLPPGTYTLSGNSKTGIAAYLYYEIINADGSVGAFDYWIGGTTTVPSKTKTLSAGQYFLVFDQQAKTESDTNKFDYFNLQLEVGSTASAFEEYHATSLPIPFNNPGTYDFLPIQEGTGDPSPENVRPITPGLTLTRDDNTTLEVWGGSLTVNADGSADVVATIVGLDLGTKTWTKPASGRFYTEQTGMKTPANTDTWLPNWYCSNYKVENYNNLSDDNCIYCLNLNQIRIKDSRYADADATTFKTVMSGVQFCYELATPVTYSLSVAETSRAFEALGLGKNLGPLYGGTVTVNEDGSVDVVHNCEKVVLGNLTVGAFETNEISSSVRFKLPLQASYGNSAYYCPSITSFTAAQASQYMGYYVGRMQDHLAGNANRVTVYAIDTDSVVVATKKCQNVSQADFTAYVSGWEVAYELATPQTYHFSSISELQSFLGTNNVWSDLNGAITVEYYKKQQ